MFSSLFDSLTFCLHYFIDQSLQHVTYDEPALQLIISILPVATGNATGTGISLLVVSPLPQLPCSFQPHDINTPSPA